MAFFWRSYLEWVEGEESAGKYLDKDKIGDEAEEIRTRHSIRDRPKRAARGDDRQGRLRARRIEGKDEHAFRIGWGRRSA
jgi:hypothetical protein